MSNSSSSSGITFTGLLTIALIVLKLTNVIDWHWIWVLSPLWIGFLFAILILGFIILFVNIKYKSMIKPKHKSKWMERLEQLQQRKK